MKQLPESFLDQMKELLKDEYDDFVRSYEEKPVSSLRINTSKISVRDFLNINPFHLTPIPWTSDGFYYSEDDDPSRHPYYHAGLYYIQEASAMLPGETLPVEENDIILDACAAPGGKSLKLADKLNDTGVLFSNDVSVSRCQVLLKNLESHGVKNAVVMADDLKDLDRFEGFFDKILVDAPCSGEGMFRKEPDLIKNWLKYGNEHYAEIQKDILARAVRLLKPGGKIVYSTCTFSMKENEEVIEHVLDLYDDIEVLPFRRCEGFMSGLTERTRDCARLFPHRVKGEGHFTALLGKRGNKESRKPLVNNGNAGYGFLKDFRIDMKDKELVEFNGKYYLRKDIGMDLKGLRILRNGLYLGEMKHERFEPSQALASALRMDEYDNVLNFDLNDDRVIKYLKCETLDVKDRYVNGCVLVCADGHPLGFGIADKGILKNKYPANYRYK